MGPEYEWIELTTDPRGYPTLEQMRLSVGCLYRVTTYSAPDTDAWGTALPVRLLAQQCVFVPEADRG